MFNLEVPNISSEQCAATIRRVVKQVDESAFCDVDIQARRVRLDSPYPVADFIEALEEVGYAAMVPKV